MCFRGILDMNLPLSGPFILEKAQEYASSLGNSEFPALVGYKCSRSDMDYFRKRSVVEVRMVR